MKKSLTIIGKMLLKAVREDVDRFVGDAEQFDDLTMLCVRYLGP